MGWDERVFGWVYRQFQSNDRDDSQAETVILQDHLESLELFASALALRQIQIRPSADLEQPDLNFLPLPRSVSVFRDASDNLWVYRYRIAQHVVLSQMSNSSTDSSSLWDASLVQYEQTYPIIARLFPGFDLANAQSANPIEGVGAAKRGKWWSNSSDPRHLIALIPRNVHRMIDSAPNPTDLNSLSSDEFIEIEVATAAKAQLVQLDEEDHNPLLHAFEKTNTAEEYQGGNRQQEGANTEDASSEVLDELVFRHVVRANNDTQVQFRSSAIVDAGHDEDEGAAVAAVDAYRYPEWFHNESRYRPDWCALKEYRFSLQAWTAERIELSPRERALRDEFTYFLNHPRLLPRQRDGQELDIDAVVAAQVDFHSCGYMDDRIDYSIQNITQDLAVLFLVDASLSTDGWVQNFRIGDLVQHALAVLGHTLSDIPDLFAIASFYSHSRHDCRFNWIKEFDQAWNDSLVAHPALNPTGHTRIGPILRHANHILSQMPQKRKAIFLLTDARPSDLDRYEGRHGNFDIQRALQELEQNYIETHAFVVDSHYHYRLHTMFGAANYHLYHSRSALCELVLEALEAMLV